MVQPVNGIPVMCAWEPCSKPFMAFPSAVKRHAKLYCSRPCAIRGNAQAQITRITLLCDYPPCSRPFETYPNTLKRGSTIRCCSRTCRARLLALKRYPGTFEEKFWAQVLKGSPDECWPWQGSRTPKGYGMVHVPEKKREVGTHIVAWFFAHGRWPLPGMDVCHSCDNPPCVNEKHLWEGTRLENAQDCVIKGRKPSGERHFRSKLTEAQWHEILALLAQGVPRKHTAALYGVHPTSIRSRLQRYQQNS